MPHLLIIQAVGLLPSAALTGIVSVDRLLTENLVQVLQRGCFRSAKENLAVAVTDNGIGVVLVDGFQL